MKLDSLRRFFRYNSIALFIGFERIKTPRFFRINFTFAEGNKFYLLHEFKFLCIIQFIEIKTQTSLKQ